MNTQEQAAFDKMVLALEEACGNRCNAEYNPCYAREALAAANAVSEQGHVSWNLRYADSTPKLNVGHSAFEDWFQQQPFATQIGVKQMCRDSYAAGMGDPLVTYAHPQPTAPVRFGSYEHDHPEDRWAAANAVQPQAAAVLPDGSVVTNVYEAFEAGKKAVQPQGGAAKLCRDKAGTDGYDYSTSMALANDLDALNER